MNSAGAITIDSTSLTKRANVPGLSCDYLGATRMLSSSTQRSRLGLIDLRLRLEH